MIQTDTYAVLVQAINDGDYMALSALADYLEDIGEDPRGWRKIVSEGKIVCDQRTKAHRSPSRNKMYSWYDNGAHSLNRRLEQGHELTYHSPECIVPRGVFVCLKSGVPAYGIAKDYETRYAAYSDLANAYLILMNN